MKKTLASISTILLLLSEPAQAAADGWMNVFVTETAGAGGSHYDYVIQNKSDLPITAIEWGRRSGCLGDPVLDPAQLGASTSFKAPAGFGASLKSGESGGVLVRFEGQGAGHQLTGFTLVGKSNNPLLNAGFVCIYRTDAKVWQYKAPILHDTQVPLYKLSLSPLSFEGDGAFHVITATLSGSDDQDTLPEVKLTSIRSSRSDFSIGSEVKEASIGTDDRSFQILGKPETLTVEYQITDAAGNQGFASATLTVTQPVDRTPPTLSVALSPVTIKVSNKFETVNATLTLKDLVDKAPTAKLVSIISDANDFSFAKDVANATLGKDDRSFRLLAKRTGNKDRVYKITYEASDAAGNKTSVTQTVTVVAEQKSQLQHLIDLLLDLLRRLLALFH